MGKRITFGDLNASHIKADFTCEDYSQTIRGTVESVSHYDDVTLLGIVGRTPVQRRQTQHITILEADSKD